MLFRSVCGQAVTTTTTNTGETGDNEAVMMLWMMTYPNATMDVPGIGTYTCRELQEYGETGFIAEQDCPIIQTVVNETCGCYGMVTKDDEHLGDEGLKSSSSSSSSSFSGTMMTLDANSFDYRTNIILLAGFLTTQYVASNLLF